VPLQLTTAATTEGIGAIDSTRPGNATNPIPHEFGADTHRRSPVEITRIERDQWKLI
jgi:hypothetical protein